jgi:glycosyltransferase involved in cell wall biosynthesis
MPYFSIVIPTRNRPELIGDSVASVLEQDFTDFELIVSDNSDLDRAETNFRQLAGARLDPRVRYIRPDQVLSMKDHWEWAIGHAHGEFVGVLTDRMGYRLNALSVVKDALDVHPTSLIAFSNDRLDGEKPSYRLRRRRRSGQAYSVHSADALIECSKSSFSKFLPRMLNSFCRKSVLNELKAIYGTVFAGLSPDYSYCFRVLDHLDSYVVIDESLFITREAAASNGLAFTQNRPNEHSRDFLSRYADADQWASFAPVPEFSVPGSMILLEYEVARSQQKSGRLIPVDAAAFYKYAAERMARHLMNGHDLANAARALEVYRRHHGISPGPSLGPKVSLETRGRKISRAIRHALRSLRDVSVRLRIKPKPISRHLKSRSNIDTPPFESLIDALRFEYRRCLHKKG